MLTRTYYVNDEIPENGIGPGDDHNDGHRPARPMRHIQALLTKYPSLGSSIVTVSAGVYEENMSLGADNAGLQLVGAGPDLTIIDGKGETSCISLGGFADGIVSGFTLRNGAGPHGGGIRCTGSSLILRDCAFVANATEQAGGAIYVDGPSSADISNCTFTNNSGFTGGAIGAYGTATIGLCSFEANSAVRYGGAIHVQSGNRMVRIFGCAFVRNTASEYGGGVYLDRSSLPEVVQCTFLDNSSMFGGALYNFGGTARIESCLFETNHAVRDGGAVCNKHDCAPAFANCIFRGNDAGRYGGGMTVLADQSQVAVAHCTFAGNRAKNPGGALYAQGSLGATATNCIFWGSTPAQIAGGVSISYCDVQGGWPGQGNINADPLFANPDGGDFHLRSRGGRWDPIGERWITDTVTSPCIDAGDPDSPVGEEPAPNGERINLGAYGGTVEASKSPGQ